MSETLLRNTSSAEDDDHVARALRQLDGRWAERPKREDYVTFSLARTQGAADDIYSVIRATHYYDLQPEKIDSAYEKTVEFLTNSHARYQFGSERESFSRVFAVPRRGMRRNPVTGEIDDTYASEILPFLPLYDPEFGVHSDIAQRAVTGLPPSVIETYEEDPDNRGAVVFTPLHIDMLADSVTAHHPLKKQYQRVRLARAVSFIIDQTAAFSQERLGAKIMGLGATLPSLTRFGQTIRQPDLLTTTGHGGTVHLIAETTKHIVRELDTDRVGIIGAAGSIGYASYDTLRHDLPEDIRYTLFDKHQQRLVERLSSEGDSTSSIAQSALEVLVTNDVVVTAITGQIDLDEVDPSIELDLSGKVIVDDSQPGCFDREQVESRGGKLIWVAGMDQSSGRGTTRKNAYNFGDASGIWGPNTVWGCEGEVFAIDSMDRHDMAVRQRVTPEITRRVGGLMEAAGITLAPYQSYGRPVQIRDNLLK